MVQDLVHPRYDLPFAKKKKSVFSFVGFKRNLSLLEICVFQAV